MPRISPNTSREKRLEIAARILEERFRVCKEGCGLTDDEAAQILRDLADWYASDVEPTRYDLTNPLDFASD